MAFVIGWNLILEYVIGKFDLNTNLLYFAINNIFAGTASVARSYSNYLDFLFNNKIEHFFKKYLSLPASKWFSSYPDLFAFALTMLLTSMNPF